MRDRKLVLVSNRLPFVVENADGAPRLQAACGGLISALRPLLRDTSACWIGWSGGENDGELASLFEAESSSTCRFLPVFLSRQERELFYDGFCNEILWPLFHDLQSRCNFDPRYWRAYEEVNRKFAVAALDALDAGDFLWVHDYHLMLLGSELQHGAAGSRMGYFHHIPFPPPDIFEKLPWRERILRSLLGFGRIGLQSERDRRNLIACLRRCLGPVHTRTRGEISQVMTCGMRAEIGVHPISVDFGGLAAQAASGEVAGLADRLRAQLAGCQIVLGVDRMDYTKGIPERLRAFQLLLQRNAELRGRVTLLQVVVPSREQIPMYTELKSLTERLVSEINGQFASAGWTPIHYLHRAIPAAELLAAYRAASVALVTPLKDGMNLVAKEFCAACVEDEAVLVLSEFAGAAVELQCGALLVNPYDSDAVATTLLRALDMPSRERRVRMQRMRRYLRSHDVFRWCRSACEGLDGSRHPVEREVPMYASAG